MVHAVNASQSVGIGSLAIGDIKYKLQSALLASLLQSETPVFLDFRAAYDLARRIV
jgi:methylene-tetrahydromethanopterin dehydrogenase